MTRTKVPLAIVIGVAALLSGFVLYIRREFRSDMDAARALASSGSKVVRTACGPIEYGTAGSGPAVLAVHGAGGGFDQGLELGRSLVGAGFRVIAPSRFGYLRTPLPFDASPKAQADAHACLLDALSIRKAVIIGASAGAPSAMQFCLRYPERSKAMILVVPIAFSPAPAEEKRQPGPVAELVTSTILGSDLAFWTASKLAYNSMLRAILATPPGDVRQSTADEQKRVDSVLRRIAPISLRASGIRNDQAIGGSISRYELERVRVPTLAISAQNDLFGTYSAAKYTADHIPGARFLGYPTGGHLLVGRQREVCRETVLFLKKVTAVRAPGGTETRPEADSHFELDPAARSDGADIQLRHAQSRRPAGHRPGG